MSVISLKIAALFLLAGNFSLLHGQKPVTPNASPEARALLDLYYSISGKYTLSGQHNYPDTKDRNTLFAATYTGKTPVIWSSDMGFAEDKDNYMARPDIVKEAIRQHKNGAIITICWHAVPPTADEPVTFMPLEDADPAMLKSIQGQLLDEQFKDLLTPGTALYKKWCAQVDTIAVYLKMLQDAKVPVLWRPYHEMNGNWFWWGGRVGENSTADLYRQLFDRYVNYHKLNNLLWVWNVDRPTIPIRKFSNFYPGNEYLDILSLDVYGSDFNKDYYDSLTVLSKGKPLLLGEVGNPPMPEVLGEQPNWTSWVIWAGMVRNLTKAQYEVLFNDPKILSKEDKAYWKVINPYRKVCGFANLPIKSTYPLNFSGAWMFVEEQSKPGPAGVGNVPYLMRIYPDNERMLVKKNFIVEWGDDRSSEEEIYLDGSDMKSDENSATRITTVSWTKEPPAMVINSKRTFTRGENTRETNSSETWTISEEGKQLIIHRKTEGFRGEKSEDELVYKRQ